MYTLSLCLCQHTVWFLSTVCHPFFFCYWPFADAMFCTFCSMYFILGITMYITVGAPLACNDLLMY